MPTRALILSCLPWFGYASTIDGPVGKDQIGRPKIAKPDRATRDRGVMLQDLSTQKGGQRDDYDYDDNGHNDK